MIAALRLPACANGCAILRLASRPVPKENS